MAFRIFIACILIAAAYFAFESVRFAWLQHQLFSADDIHVNAPETADITLVDFISYGCPKCKEAHPVITQALAKDGRVRYIPRPISHENSWYDEDHNSGGHSLADHTDSYFLPAVVYAAGKQGKFFEMHNALLENYRVVDDNVLEDLCTQAGVDLEQLKEDYISEDVMKLAMENKKLFTKLRLNYTPSYAVGKNILFSVRSNVPSVDEFLAIFSEARAQ